MDATSLRWVERLRLGDEQAVSDLHDALRRAALHELHRRGGPLSGPELEDVAQQCANDAVVTILAKLDDFRGLSRFSTWAYKFAIFEVSSKLARHAWQRHPPGREELTFDQLPDVLATTPGARVEARELLSTLSAAIRSDLTPRQREVFTAVALNEVPIDVLALQLESNRNAVYKNLFDARRKLRACLADAGYEVST
ncbi:RNA polymerase sigma factor [Solirubrobacter soli]|uniref:RNA polymerase sigma factor n=1 Tax=Solirubrobacter soli TaxID=363832 RepID=UPI000423F66B|nr:sigma-70 family RNA polymerase sigma factor [Solirubrobacter soli]